MLSTLLCRVSTRSRRVSIWDRRGPRAADGVGATELRALRVVAVAPSSSKTDWPAWARSVAAYSAPCRLFLSIFFLMRTTLEGVRLGP